jgi:ribosomal protein S18 acetylase RimI-like enzyme
MIEYRAIDETTRKGVIELCTRYWGSAAIVSQGTLHSAENLPGYVALEKGGIIGFITYNFKNHDCEIVTLASVKENRGIGSALMNRVILTAQEHGCHRVWLVTTNDNTRALRFYQKRGFDIAAFHRNAVEEARKLKPQIPLVGNDDIPLRHELKLEMALS